MIPLKNFEKELIAYGEENFSRYEFYSFDKFMNKMKAGNPVNCKKTMLIIDEAHNLRNYMQSHNKLSKKYFLRMMKLKEYSLTLGICTPSL